MTDAARPKFGAAEWRSIGSLAITLLVMAVLMFLPAGTLGWARGWWYLAIFIAAVIVALEYIWRVNPELFVVRQKPQPGTKSWDLIFVAVTIASLFAILPVAALDDGRFHWLPLPIWVVWLGYLLFLFGFWLVAWAQGVNRHFELTVRIQTDRGHKVIDTGPYAIIRHPGYVGGTAVGLGTALALGSLVALIPVAVLAATLALRTLAEERTLAAELPGYAEYMQGVRYRWVPGVW